MHKSYNKSDQMYFDTINDLNELNKKILKYRFRELEFMENDDEYRVYLNRLHKDIRIEMTNIPLAKAREMAVSHLQRFKDLQTTLSCLKITRDSIYGNYSGGIF